MGGEPKSPSFLQNAHGKSAQKSPFSVAWAVHTSTAFFHLDNGLKNISIGLGIRLREGRKKEREEERDQTKAQAMC